MANEGLLEVEALKHIAASSAALAFSAMGLCTMTVCKQIRVILWVPFRMDRCMARSAMGEHAYGALCAMRMRAWGVQGL